MTLNYIYKNINEIMEYLADINWLSYDKHIQTANQKRLNNAYFKLDMLKDELIREHIKNKQRVGK